MDTGFVLSGCGGLVRPDVTLFTESLPQDQWRPASWGKEDKEELFKLKLKVFELQIVKDSEDRKLKSVIRKADNPLDVFYYYVQYGPN